MRAFKSLSTMLAASLLAAMACLPHAAIAGPVDGTFDIKIYQGWGNGSGSAATEQANLANPLFNTSVVADVTYTGALDFNASSNSLGAFFSSAGGTYTGLGAAAANLISSGNFAWTTLFSITGVAGVAGSGTITHDDGVSLYQGGNTLLDSAAPTVAKTDAYSIAAGAFNLVYVEANDLPAVLCVDFNPAAVPEPASLAVLAIGLAGLYSLRRTKTA